MAIHSFLRSLGQLHLAVRLGAVGCVLLIIIVLFLAYRLFNLPGGDSGMGLGMVFVVGIPLLSIPVGICCLVGAVVSAKAFICENDFKVARVGFRAFVLSVVFPLIVIACYAVCLALMLKHGV